MHRDQYVHPPEATLLEGMCPRDRNAIFKLQQQLLLIRHGNIIRTTKRLKLVRWSQVQTAVSSFSSASLQPSPDQPPYPSSSAWSQKTQIEILPFSIAFGKGDARKLEVTITENF